jgi:flagellar hook protein FlgE
VQYTASVDANGKLVFSQTATTAPSTVGDIQVNAPLSVADGSIVDNTGGAFSAAEIEAAAPKVASYTVDTTGNVVMTMTDGSSFDRGQVLMQNVQDPTALVREPGNKYSGQAAAGVIGGNTLSAANNAPGSNGLGKIQSGTLELSNVDLTEQFSEMIAAQRSFQAGSRIITVSDQVLEEVVNLKR